MVTYVIRRLLFSIPVIVAASIIIFFFVSAAGDPLAGLRQNPRISEQTIQNISDRKHLDESLPVQYGYWVNDVFTNSFGTTLLQDTPIWPDLKRVLANTMQLIIAAEILSVLIAIGIGVYSAVKQYSAFDYLATTTSFLGFSTPIFWLALILQVLVTNLFLSTGYRLFYTSQLSAVDPANFWIDRIQHLALPVLTLTVIGVAQFTRYMRSSMLEVINSDYVRTARAKGLKESRVIMKHAFRNALIPLVTIVAIDFGQLFGGAIATETVFSLDGMGLYFIRALEVRDIYPIMAWLMVTSVIIIVFNLIADVLYGVLDPRIRYD